MRTDFKNMLSTYDALIAKDKTKADSLNAQKEKIQDLLDQLNTSKKLSANQIYKLRKENELLAARVEAMASAKRVEELYETALNAMRSYAGYEPMVEEDYED
jgi:peptidoglycan hydrolase CwlO-like protein